MQVATKNESIETQKRQLCTFWISKRQYGVDILDVKEVNPEVGFTPIFHAPEEIKGYINIRGQLYLLLDLRLILGIESKEVDEASRAVLFKSEVGEPFGVLVDRIGDTVTIDHEQIEDRRKEDLGPSEDVERRGLELGEGVCKLEDGLLVILSARNLLDVIGNLKEYMQGTL